MMITVGTIMNSAYAGAYPGGKTITGGDLRIGDFYRGLVPIQHTEGLKALPSVAQVVPIRYSLGFEGLTRIERFGDSIIKFGGKYDSIFGTVKQSFHLGIFDPIEYEQLHNHDSIVQLQDRNVNFKDLMTELSNPYTVILQDRLSRQLGGLKTNDLVRIRFDGFEANFTVIGIFQVLPGIYWSYYTTDNPFDKQFVGLISWNTYEHLIDDNLGKIDVIARNKVNPPSDFSNYLPEQKYWGYVSTPIDYQTLENLAEQTGLVNNISRRATSPFFQIPRFQWKTNLTAYDPNINLSDYSASPADEKLDTAFNKTLALQNVLWHEKGSISTNWNPLSSRAIIIDPERDQGFGNTSIKATLPQIPISYRNSLDEIFSWSNTNLIGMNVCVVNEIYVNINFTNGHYDYVKRFVPGENLRLYFNESIYTDFLVIATTNSHYPYEYVNEAGKHFGDTAVFNYKALSFNPYTAEGGDWNYFYEVTDADPNTIFLSNKFYLPDVLTNEVIPNLINQSLELNQQQNPEITPLDPLWWINTALENMYMLNMTPFNGTVKSKQWVGNYTFNGQQYSFDGAQITYLGETSEVPFNITISNGTKILENLISGNSTFSLDNYTSILYFDLDDHLTLDDIRNFIQTMESVCQTIPSLANISFFAPKLFLLEESGLFNVYFFIGAESKSQINNALQNIESYYALHNLPWRTSWNKIATKTEQDVGGFLGLIVSMFFGVLSFALISSLLGLAISTIISVKKRFSEIGTLRTLGFTSGQILTMIIGEGVITAILGIIVGIIAGLLIASLIINNLPFMVFLPILFTPPTETIAGGVVLLLIASIAVNFLPALSAVRIDIAEAIRTKGE
jgi:hypothetical protein